MLDRGARDKMVAIIENYLDEKITAFQFDDQIEELALTSKDQTVRYARRALWYFYDDCQDHMVTLSEQGWKYFQRLLLLLRSDASVRVQRRRIWSWRQVAAAFLLGGFGAVAGSVGWGHHLFVYAMPFGILSILLSLTRRRQPAENEQILLTLMPFGTLAELFNVHRTVSSFVKRPYPGALRERRIRSAVMNVGLRFQFYATWALFSPIALLLQLLPDVEARVNVEPEV